jgi:hypothetical protein
VDKVSEFISILRQMIFNMNELRMPGYYLVASFFLAVNAVAASAEPTPPVPSLTDAVARLEYGKPTGTINLLLKVDGIAEADLKKDDLVAKVADLGGQSGPPIVKSEVLAKALPYAGKATRFWMLTLEASGVPIGTTQIRGLSMVVGGVDRYLPYTLTNTAAENFTWTVKISPNITQQREAPIPVSITVGPVAATGVKVLQTALFEKTLKIPLAPTGLKLCPSEVNQCDGSGLTLQAHTPNQLWLWGASEVGIFEGSLSLAASEKPEGDSVTLNINSSTNKLKTIGVLVIFLSVLVTWFVTVLVRGWINRKQLLLPVLITRKTLASLSSQFSKGHAVVAADNVSRCIAAVVSRLSDVSLTDNGLPPIIPLTSGGTTAGTVDSYRRYVQAQSDWVQALAILLAEGLEQAWSKFSGATTDYDRQRARDAVAQIDQLVRVTTAPTPDAIRVALRTIVETMNQPATAKDGPNRAWDEYLRSISGSTRSPEQQIAAISGLNALSWLFVIAASTLGGAYLFVYGPSGVGFGTSVDFLACILWGMGLPAGTQLLQSSTTGSISTVFGVTK